MERFFRRLGARHAAGDDGAILLIALAFVSMVGLFASAVLSYGATSLRGHSAYANDREERFAADGAIDAAITVLREDVDAGRDPQYGGACPDTAPMPSFELNGVEVDLSCEAQPESGEPQISAEDPEQEVAEHALLALGDHPAEGIVRQGAASLNLAGSIYSHSKIDSAGPLVTAGKVYAVGECSELVVSLSPPLQCHPDGPDADDPLGADPGFGPAVSYAPNTATVPVPPSKLGVYACTGAIFTLSPGRYTDAVALTTLTTQCPAATIHLQPAADGPGVYHFDFEQVGPTDDASDHVWTINRTGVKVVGGTPKNWVAGAPAALPGACETSAPHHGVQLIFSGNSRVDLVTGSMEVCGQPTDDEQAVAIYGVPSAQDSSLVVNGVGASGTNFRMPELAAGASDDVWTTAIGSNSASVQVGFQTNIPENGSLESVTVRVKHRESPGSSPQLVITPGNGPACPPIPLTEEKAGHTEGANGNATACITSAAALDGMTARFEASPGADGWAKVDSFTLELGFNGPPVGGLTGCLVEEPYVAIPADPTAPCAVVHSAPGTTFAVQGTIYAPTAAVHLELGAASVQTVSRGIIARTIKFDATVGVAIPGDPVGHAPASTRADREVEIVASVNGEVLATALVRFGDGGGLTPGAAVDVLGWNLD